MRGDAARTARRAVGGIVSAHRVLLTLQLTSHLALVGCSAPAGSPSEPPRPQPSRPADAPDVLAMVGAPRVFVRPVDGGDALVFGGELAALRAAAAEGLRTQHRTALNPLGSAELLGLEIVRASGKARRGGPTCRRQPSLERVALASYPDLLGANVRASCRDGCVVEVSVVRPGSPFVGLGRGDPVFRSSRAVEDPERVESYLRALGSIGAAGTAALPPKRLDDVELHAQESGLRIERIVLGRRFADPFALVEPTRASCSPGRYEALVELDAAGRLTQCEERATWRPACALCTAFRTDTHKPGVEGRRARVTVHVPKPKSFKWLTGSGGSWKSTWLAFRRPHATDDGEAIQDGDDRVAACMLPTRRSVTPADGGSIQVKATITIGRADDGTVSHVELADVTGLEEGHRACLTEAIRSLAFPCPLDPTPLTVTVEGIREATR
jgi:hypothetical protein